MVMRGGPVDPEVKKELKHSLSAFERAAKKAAEKVARKAAHNPMLHEALYSRNVQQPYNIVSESYTPTGNMLNEGFASQHAPVAQHEYAPNKTPVMGVQTGNFAVFPVPNAAGKNRYDVANMSTGQKLVGGLHLLEAANGIVKMLNKGYSFYSPQIKQILEFEEKYTKHYNDAVVYKRKSKESSKDAIMETRFEEARAHAQAVKENLQNFCSKL